FTVDIACIEMRYRHRWCTDFGFAVYFSLVLIYDFFIITHEEETTYREAPNIFRLRNICLLQKRQTAAPCTDKYKISGMIFHFTVVQVLNFDLPLVFLSAADVLNSMLEIHFHTLFFKSLK